VPRVGVAPHEESRDAPLAMAPGVACALALRLLSLR